MIGTLISLLLTIPPDITVAIITPDNSDPLNADDTNVIIATVMITYVDYNYIIIKYGST